MKPHLNVSFEVIFLSHMDRHMEEYVQYINDVFELNFNSK